MHKCQAVAQTKCQFLGFEFDPNKFCMKLPETKKLKLLENIKQMKRTKRCSIKNFAQLIGQLIVACPAIPYSWLYTKFFDRTKTHALRRANGNCKEHMVLPNNLQTYFNWWLSKISEAENPIRRIAYKKTIYTDASTTGWGAHDGKQKTHGWWDSKERLMHINYLELKAILYGLKSLAKNETNCSILIRVDNTTAIAYINRMGGTKFDHLYQIAETICKWCEKRKIIIRASYIHTKDNVIADAESRIKSTNTEWELSSDAYGVIERTFGPFDVDLFASKNNTKCKKYVSWLPDPEAIAVDAFTLNWSDSFFYAFPPFIVDIASATKNPR